MAGGHYVVTGCAGFVGSHLTDSLLAAGHAVTGIDAFTDYYPRTLKEANLNDASRSPRFALVEADLATMQLESVLAGVDGVFHLGAQPGVRASWGTSFQAYTDRNVLATQRVFEAAARRAVKVVFASSSSVYGDAAAYPTREDVTPRPRSPYGVTKLTCEHLADAYASNFGLDVVSLRYFTVFGPRQRPDMAFARMFSALFRGAEFEVFGRGDQSRDFTFVSDAVAAAESAMGARGARGAYNVSGGGETTLRQAIEMIEAISGTRLRVRFVGPAAGDVRRTSADTSRVLQDLGWSPSVGLEAGLRAQLDWTAAQADREALV